VSSLGECLRSAAAVVFAVLALRAFPVTVAFFASAASCWRDKIVALAGYLATAYLAARYFDFRADRLLIAYVYLCAASTLLFFMPRPKAGTTRMALFPLMLGVFLIVPAMLLPQDTLVLLLGWDLALSVYSYCVDVAPAARNIEQYWFFVFVNPTVAYVRRGTQVGDPGLHARGLLRVIAGVAALGFSGAAMSAKSLPEVVHPAALASVAAVTCRVAGIYAAQWGLASLQIGLFRQLGYDAPERYLKPFAARSPREFWTRWNTYLGTWVRIYVFAPLVRAMRARPTPSAATSWRVRLIAVLVSFTFVGALHDLYSTLVVHRVSLGATLWFSANALAIVIWELASRRRTRIGSAWAARLAMAAAMLGLAMLFP
jgi:hypothetical protein